MSLRVKAFKDVLLKGCERAARKFALRQWPARSDIVYFNPFPEHYAVAEAVMLLKGQGVVLPEVSRHVVARLGRARQGRPRGKGNGGRFDLGVFSVSGRPLAVAEYKWFWNSIEKDAKAVAGVASQLARPPRGFVVVMGAIGPKDLQQEVRGAEPSRATLTKQRNTLESKLCARLERLVNDVGAHGIAFSKVVKCRVVEPGSADTWALFQAVVGELRANWRKVAGRR